ncbi:MAG: hypothetical protein IJJ81_01925 [Ruminococcus sp.]|uniref:hypothetical protein n=1 Tax=Ruminococcus flavefaciens TaxID=1265 RepID=UPI0026F2B3D7|nr:hypothetical protein [Ruminococcus flavefaciens]MBR0511316.1 hypothetical protein [Ruminococcus sp.]
MKASIFLTAALIAVVLTGCTDNNTDAELFSEMTTAEITTETPISVTTTEAVTEPASVSRSLLSFTEDIDLRDTDGGGQNYLFDYDGRSFSALYEPDNWHITDSYLIEDRADLVIICQALIDVNPVHNRDMTGWRTAEDMAYEWDRHNKAYYLMPESSEWKSSAKDVDLDAKDDGKSSFDLFMDKIRE